MFLQPQVSRMSIPAKGPVTARQKIPPRARRNIAATEKQIIRLRR